MTHTRAERAALCDLLDELGPAAPTLCEGWATADLAAHLVLRERRPDALGGIAVKALAPYTASVQDRLKARHPYPELVDLVRQGPPRWTPYGLIPGADELVNTVELFVHHEDVRRAQPDWEPRELSAGLDEVLWKRLRTMARVFFRRSPVGVVLRRADGEKVAARMAEPAVVVSGEAQELLLLAFGRQAHAWVTFEGDPHAVAALRRARLGV
ncbi:TIGR03085 family metal-binding protein [Microtetraspora sp. NBRC 16547]|uniref:TIGR03085 family metal-binding protein n=1 Tax=Microtetraspora sp. NBRC 16547 TaxID=3030993 RepID=UPI0024A0A00C|nr:TIGR03085 family metal-binding protein [Microtetraspora sp. NBRC 16547]GLW97354.1 TIGR03085 family protein [Microtetraspora sp. NBRC 16547]